MDDLLVTQEITIANEPIDLVSSSTTTCTKAGTYYRSRLFTANCGINDLVTAGQAIITLISTCRLTNSNPQLDQLIENITHELLTFESRAKQLTYDDNTINIAKFIFTVTIDQALATSQTQLTLFDHFYPDKNKKNIFLVIDHLLTDPDKYVELIELSYLCLNLGFNTIYHEDDVSINIDILLEKLYQAIRQYRSDKEIQLFLSETENTTRTKNINIPLRTILILCLLTFVFVYCGFAYIININTSLLPSSLQDVSKNVMSVFENENI